MTRRFVDAGVSIGVFETILNKKQQNNDYWSADRLFNSDERASFNGFACIIVAKQSANSMPTWPHSVRVDFFLDSK